MQNYLLDAGRRVNGSDLDPNPNPFNLSYWVIGLTGYRVGFISKPNPPLIQLLGSGYTRTQ